MSTIKSFVKQFIASVTGDDVQAQAEKTFRQAQSALKSQIASLDGDTINLEESVKEAQDALEGAKINNGELIDDRNYYVSNLISAQNSVTEAEEDLAAHKTKIEFLKKTLAELEADVEA